MSEKTQKITRSLFKSPFFWLSASLLSGFCYFFAFYFFPKTFPLINLAITMNREQALASAQTIADKHLFGPTDPQSAVMFHTDGTTKTFIELEAGGKEAFIHMMENNLYMPYSWNVRHFKEGEKNEAVIKFTPNGKPYGFVETISENNTGAQLTEEQAQQIAYEMAESDWVIDFSHYKLIESSQKIQPSNRIDHTLVYERTDATIGEGFYRLKIVVSGDKVTELSHFVKIPETFLRRYDNMRSANNTIAWAATIIMALLYIIGGCGIGLYYMIKNKWIIWKQALVWGVIIASLTTLTSFNQFPFLWMYYNSAHSAQGFVVQLSLSFIIGLLSQACLLTLIIMAAESLTRRAFGNHPQLWSLWISHNKASYALLGRTLGAYLLVGFNCAFVIAFYLISTRYWGWWTPSEMIFDPNILATYAPWLSPLALSLQAGFIEECLFRAIPLAGAALLGQRFGKKNIWIGAAFILQALVFGAAHANYPTQPAYGRLIELLIPSFIWGAIYLRFGLLSTIITHVVYDIIWFSIPIFISTAPSAFLYKIIIIIASLIPLLVVAYGRLKHGVWKEFEDRNFLWVPYNIAQDKKEEYVTDTSVPHKSSFNIKATLALCIISIIVWIYATPFTHDGITITTARNDAVKSANSFLHNKNIQLDSEWQTLPLFFTHYNLIPALNMQHKFIWQEGKKELYHQLLNTHLEPAHWTVRYAQFEGDIIERAEEHRIFQYDTTRHYHQLPESSAGKQLTKEEARVIAHQALRDIYALEPAQLTEISALETQKPNRRDWFFTFRNTQVYLLATGQARINIVIAGDEVIDAARIIHVPEEWERNEQKSTQQLSIIALIISFIFMLMLIVASYIMYKQNIRSLFSKKLFLFLWIVFVSLSFISLANSWPSLIGAFNTMEPLQNQLLRTVVSLIVLALVKSTALALIITYLLGIQEQRKLATRSSTVLGGITAGLCLAAITNLAESFLPQLQPLWPIYIPLNSTIPMMASLIEAIFTYSTLTLFIALLNTIITKGTKNWQKHKLFFGAFFIILGLLTVSLPSLSIVPVWFALGATVGIVMLLLHRYCISYDSAQIPLATGAFVITTIIQQGMFNAYPGALLAAVINTCVIIIISSLWFKQMNR